MQVPLPPCKFTALFNGTIPDNTSPLVPKLHSFFRHYLRWKRDQISTFFPSFRHFSPRTIQLADMRKISSRAKFHQLSNATNRVSLLFIVSELRPLCCKYVTAYQSQPSANIIQSVLYRLGGAWPSLQLWIFLKTNKEKPRSRAFGTKRSQRAGGLFGQEFSQIRLFLKKKKKKEKNPGIGLSWKEYSEIRLFGKKLKEKSNNRAFLEIIFPNQAFWGKKKNHRFGLC